MKGVSLLSFLAVAANGDDVQSQATCSGTTAGQAMIWVTGCQGVGCKANGVDQDCAWCVYDDAACRKAYGDACGQTEDARAAQNAYCSPPQPKVKAQATCSGRTAGQEMIWVPGCQGVGCKANGVDQDCAWCVYDDAACRKAFGTCQPTEDARAAQNAYCTTEKKEATNLSISAASCSGSADPASATPYCFSGTTAGTTVSVKVTSYANGKGTADILGRGMFNYKCMNKAMTKNGQKIEVDTSDCMPKGVKVKSLTYCSDQDEIVAEVAVAIITVPVELKKAACSGLEALDTPTITI